jgi:hypothetical protein
MGLLVTSISSIDNNKTTLDDFVKLIDENNKLENETLQNITIDERKNITKNSSISK